jgi:hypothetical protein
MTFLSETNLPFQVTIRREGHTLRSGNCRIPSLSKMLVACRSTAATVISSSSATPAV